jgi:hypothetical protein
VLTGLEGRLAQYFGGFFHQIKVHPAAKYRNKGFYKGRLPKNEEVRGIFILSSKEL